ncbi:MAG: hypothetical protein JW923_09275 [Spirochaetales bacterium]|nr:hypothetical protein [Spirochaetales bacterium]MBP7263571.1 hypothetical protein [Spirochaetia bacterium]
MNLGKRILWLVVALSASGTVFAQNTAAPNLAQAPDDRAADYGLAEARRDIRVVNLGQDEAERILERLAKDGRELERARAEIREAQARVARLLLDEKPDLGAIQDTVRKSLEAEYLIRMAQIRRNLDLRALLGDQRWAALWRLSREYTTLARSGDLRRLADKADDAERLAPLIEVLKALQ